MPCVTGRLESSRMTGCDRAAELAPGSGRARAGLALALKDTATQDVLLMSSWVWRGSYSSGREALWWSNASDIIYQFYSGHLPVQIGRARTSLALALKDTASQDVLQISWLARISYPKSTG